MPKVVDYYFSPPSPWTYLGHWRFAEIAKRHGASINLKPVDLAAKVFPVSGGLPLPKRAPQRQAYRLVELERWRDYLRMPLTLTPKFFPVDPTISSLMILAAHPLGEDKQMQLAGAIMRATWAEERNIADEATLKAIAQENDIDGAALLAKSAEQQAHYDALTQEAIERGVFGAPSYVYNNEIFWGQDRLDFVERALAKG